MFRRACYGTAGLAVAATVFDTIANDELDTVFSSLQSVWRVKPTPEERLHLPRILVLGTGWGACSFLRKLDTDKFNVTVVSPRNYFLYTPLLAGTCVGTVEPRSIVEPIRSL